MSDLGIRAILSQVCADAYRLGVSDERISEDNIGICGFGAKVEPARERTHTFETKSS